MKSSFPSRIIKLKSGASCTIRQAVPEDAAAFVAFINANIENSSTIPLLPGEYVHDAKSQATAIEEYLNNSNCLLLVAEYEGKLIANIDLTGHVRKRLYHTAMIGMGILDGWRNQGLGTALLTAVINWAQEESPIELIWLNVYASNDLGLGLYEKMGFIHCGRIPKFFKHGELYLDNITMYLPLV